MAYKYLPFIAEKASGHPLRMNQLIIGPAINAEKYLEKLISPKQMITICPAESEQSEVIEC